MLEHQHVHAGGRAEICAYYDRVMRERLLPSGRVRYLPMAEHVGDGRVVSRLTGDTWEVKARKATVDARYLEPTIPKTTPPPFEVEPGTRCIPVGELAQVAERADRYVIVGAGKTAIDACLWLLENGVDPDAITWVKPREAWVLNRYFTQSGSLVGQLMEGISLQAEAAARATSPDDLFRQLADREQLLRVDETMTPTMFRGPTMSVAELSLLRQVTNVVRLGHIRSIERDKIVLEHGTVPTSTDAVHVHCAASGISLAPEIPIFEPGRITLQCIRIGLQPFNAALTAYVEIARDDIAEKNRLCPPNRQPNAPADWIRGTLTQWAADREWSKQDDLAGWLDRSRLNASRGLSARLDEPRVQEAMARFVSHVRPGDEQPPHLVVRHALTALLRRSRAKRGDRRSTRHGSPLIVKSWLGGAGESAVRSRRRGRSRCAPVPVRARPARVAGRAGGTSR